MKRYLQHSLFYFSGILITGFVLNWDRISLPYISLLVGLWLITMVVEYRHQRIIKAMDQDIARLEKQVAEQIDQAVNDYEFR